MLKITDFCYNIDSEAPDHFKFLQEVGKLPQELKSRDAMNEQQWDVYTDCVNKFKKQFYSSSDDVKKLVLRDLRYGDTHMINPHLMLNIDNYYED